MAEVLDLKKLAEKYEYFIKPVYEITINDTKLEEEFLNQEMRAEITAGFEASALQFKIYNAFEKQTNQNTISCKKNISSLLKPGNMVSVNAGYLGKAQICIFKGYIDGIYLDYEKNGEIVYTIECLDAKGIMMNSIHSESKKSIKKCSLAAEDVLKKYTALLKLNTATFYKQDKEMLVPIEQHNESDYHFVVRMAKQIGCSFYILAGEVFFEHFQKRDKSIAIQYHIQSYLDGFTVYASMKDRVNHILVRSSNENMPDKAFEAKADSYEKTAENGTASAASLSNVLTQRVAKVITDVTVTSNEEAKQRAEVQMNRMAEDVVTGSIKTPGIPELKPGKICSLEGFGKSFDKKYYITKVIHTIEKGNFKTICEIEVNQF